MLAAEYGCRVTGVDLSPEFIEAAQALTDRCGLSERCSFEVGDATALRFEEGTFDAVWTEHVVMNVRDRQRFYNEAFRVLRPGGRLAFFDILLGDEQRELEYPLPWARSPEISFVHTSAETRAFLTTAGFVEESWEQLSLQQVPPPPFNPAFGLHLVIGEDFPQRVGNFVKCNIDGRLVVVRGIFRKPT